MARQPVPAPRRASARVVRVCQRPSFLSQPEILDRYRVTAEKLNGWSARRSNPFPAAVLVGGRGHDNPEPFWPLLVIVAWE
jgi:hypothetical protein